jgi:stress-induced morphogen
MAMKPDEVIDCIQRALPDAEIVLEALVNDGEHYKVTVTAEAFRGLSRIKQHQLIMDAFEGRVGNELHALSITTKIPS